MERLTKFDCMVKATAPGNLVQVVDFLGKPVAHGPLVKRLFDYEETGYTPEELKALLPAFRIGQTVWYVVRGEIYSANILAIELRKDEIYLTLDDDWGGDQSEFFATEHDAILSTAYSGRGGKL